MPQVLPRERRHSLILYIHAVLPRLTLIDCFNLYESHFPILIVPSLYMIILLAPYLPLTSRFPMLIAPSLYIIILPHSIPRVSKESSVDA